MGNIEHGNSRASPEVAEGEQLYWQCDFDYFHYPGNGESVCRNGALVPAPECRPSKLSCCCDFIRKKNFASQHINACTIKVHVQFKRIKQTLNKTKREREREREIY